MGAAPNPNRWPYNTNGSSSSNAMDGSHAPRTHTVDLRKSSYTIQDLPNASVATLVWRTAANASGDVLSAIPPPGDATPLLPRGPASQAYQTDSHQHWEKSV